TDAVRVRTPSRSNSTASQLRGDSVTTQLARVMAFPCRASGPASTPGARRRHLKVTLTGSAPGRPSYRAVTSRPAFGGRSAENEPTLTKSPDFRAKPSAASVFASQATALSG